MIARNTRQAAVRHVSMALAVSVSALSLAACGDGGSDDTAAKKGNDITVGLLLPDRDTARFEKFDYPLIKEEVASLTDNKGKVRYANAEASVTRQSEQFQKMIADKVDVTSVQARASRSQGVMALAIYRQLNHRNQRATARPGRPRTEVRGADQHP